ncbi:MAG: F0F1 ATP synthase subunit B [Natronosporangium sp.]
MLAAEEEPSPVLPHIEEILLGLVAFGLLLFVLTKYALPKFEQVYTERTEQIEGGIERAQAAQAEANQLLAQYRQQLAGVRTEAAKIRDDARADAAGIREEMLAQAREESDRIITAGRDALATERASLVRELRAELGRLSVDLAGRIVGESLADEARRAGTVERFLSELESADLAAAGGSVAAANGGAAPAGAR